MKLLSYALVLLVPLMCASPSKDSNFNYSESPVIDHESEVFNTNISSSENDIAKKIIKTSYLKFETQNLESSYNNIIKAVNKSKGFVQDDNSNTSYNTVTRHLIIRIPTSNFQITIDSISKDVSHFDSKRISSKDVTEEFIDIEARLKAKRTLEKRYLELLTKAKNVKEILEIERELSNIREDIEAKQGRLKYLQNKVSLSTINIEFYKLTSNTPITTSYGTKMCNAVKDGFNAASLFILGLLYIWPLIIIMLIGIFLLKRYLKKSKK